MNKIEIDIIIPCLNSALTIERALHSLKKQTNQNFSIILVDDGSSDGTGEIARAYADENNLSFKLITHENNLGTSSAMNDGVNASENEWVTFLGSDDEFIENWLEAMLQVKERVGGYDVYACTAYLVDQDGHAKHHKEGMPSREITLSDIYVRNKILSAGCFVNRDVFEKLGGFTVGMYNEDYDLWMRALAQGYRIYEEVDPLYRYYIGGEGQVTSNQRIIVASSTVARLTLIASGKISEADITGFKRGMQICWRDLIISEHSKALSNQLKKPIALMKKSLLTKALNIFADVIRKIILGLSVPLYSLQARKEIARIASNNGLKSNL